MARLYVRLNEETDKDIIGWLDAQECKTAAVKAAIRAAMGGGHSEPASVDLDLGAIRCVFEAVLDERLAGLTVATGGNNGGQEDKELAAKLDAMF